MTFKGMEWNVLDSKRGERKCHIKSVLLSFGKIVLGVQGSEDDDDPPQSVFQLDKISCCIYWLFCFILCKYSRKLNVLPVRQAQSGCPKDLSKQLPGGQRAGGGHGEVCADSGSPQHQPRPQR